MRRILMVLALAAVAALATLPAAAGPPSSGSCNLCCEWECSANAWCTRWDGRIVSCWTNYGKCQGSGNCQDVEWLASASTELEVLEQELFGEEAGQGACSAPAETVAAE